MAARSDSLMVRQHQVRMLVGSPASRTLTLGERVARIQRRRRLSIAASAFESALWLAGAGVIAAISVLGLSGLR